MIPHDDEAIPRFPDQAESRLMVAKKAQRIRGPVVFLGDFSRRRIVGRSAGEPFMDWWRAVSLVLANRRSAGPLTSIDPKFE